MKQFYLAKNAYRLNLILILSFRHAEVVPLIKIGILLGWFASVKLLAVLLVHKILICLLQATQVNLKK